MLKYSQNSVDLVKQFEDEPGFLAGACSQLVAYPDPGTGSVPFTIGFGHTPAFPGQKITPAEADRLLIQDLDAAWFRVCAWFASVPLTQGMIDALTSLSQNVGSIPYVAPRLTTDIRAGRFADAAVQFLDIDKDAGGRVMPGLSRRRAAESALFLRAG